MSSVSDSLTSLAKSAGIITLGSIVGRGLGLLGEVFIARRLNPEIYGEVALAYSIVVMVGSLLVFGVNEGVTKLGSSETKNNLRQELYISGILSVIVSGSVGILLLLVFQKRISEFMSEPELARYFILFSPFLIIFPLSKIVIAILRVQKRTTAMVVARQLVGRTSAVGLLILLFILGLQANAAVAYWVAIPSTVVLLGGYFATQRIDTKNLTIPSIHSFSNLWRFSWPLAMSSIVFLILARLDILMIGYLLNSTDVGNYRAIQPLQQAATLVIGSLSFLFLPLATEYYDRGELDELDELFTTVTKWAVLLTIPVILVFTVTSREVVEVIFGSEYRRAALPLAILSGGIFIRTLVGPNGDMIKAIDTPKVELYAGVVGLTVNFALNYILIPIFGIAGAALATVGGYAVYNFVEVYIIYSKTGVTPFSLSIIKPLIVSSAVVWLMRKPISVESDIISIVVFGSIGGLSVIVSLILTKSVEPRDMVLIDKLEARTNRDLSVVRKTFEKGLN